LSKQTLQLSQKNLRNLADLTGPFLGRPVVVKCVGDITVQGRLTHIDVAKHGPFGNVILEDENGRLLIRGDCVAVVTVS